MTVGYGIRELGSASLPAQRKGEYVRCMYERMGGRAAAGIACRWILIAVVNLYNL